MDPHNPQSDKIEIKEPMNTHIVPHYLIYYTINGISKDKNFKIQIITLILQKKKKKKKKKKNFFFFFFLLYNSLTIFGSFHFLKQDTKKKRKENYIIYIIYIYNILLKYEIYTYKQNKT
ncbi:hypothetical protein PFMALIP_05538 [Plasmodium falciparum MaliPS096_E11]|uniref:Uncharacterized protein n=1 Tax=Plasmodium falciparum MaliPS096_E11 TaxID=1036727 RepID=A0A024WH15_PLAFA|nr:hypothetical protein PFMALIP_05538 [Plasmodium falciparum MaliPS096_E11]